MKECIKILMLFTFFCFLYIFIGISYSADAQILQDPPPSERLANGLMLNSPNNNILGIDKVRTGNSSNPETILGVFGERNFSDSTLPTFIRIREFNGSSWISPSTNVLVDHQYNNYGYVFYSLVIVNDFDNDPNNSIGGGFITVGRTTLNAPFHLIIYYFNNGVLNSQLKNIRFDIFGNDNSGAQDFWRTFKHVQNGVEYFVATFYDGKSSKSSNQLWFKIKEILNSSGNINLNALYIRRCPSIETNPSVVCRLRSFVNGIANDRNVTVKWDHLINVIDSSEDKDNMVTYIAYTYAYGEGAHYTNTRLRIATIDNIDDNFGINIRSIVNSFQFEDDLSSGEFVTGVSLYFRNNYLYVLYSSRKRNEGLDYDRIVLAVYNRNNLAWQKYYIVDFQSMNTSDISIGDFSIIENNLYFSYYFDDQNGAPDLCNGYKWYRINPSTNPPYQVHDINCNNNKQIPYGGVFLILMNSKYYYFVGNNFRMFNKDMGYIAPHPGEGMGTNVYAVWHYVYLSIPDSCESMTITYTPINENQQSTIVVNARSSANTMTLPKPGTPITISSVRHLNAPNFSTFWMRPANLTDTQLDDRCNYFLINSNTTNPRVTITTTGNTTQANFTLPNNIYSSGLVTNLSNCNNRLDFSQGIVFGVNYVDWREGNRWCRNAGPSPSGGSVYQVSGGRSIPVSPAQSCNNYCVIVASYRPSTKCEVTSPTGNVNLLTSGLSISFHIKDAVFSNVSSIIRYSVDLSNISIQDDNFNDRTLRIIRGATSEELTNDSYPTSFINDGVNLNYNINIPRWIFKRTEFNDLAGTGNIPIVLKVITNNQLTLNCNFVGSGPPGSPPGTGTGTLISLPSFQISHNCITPYRWNVTIIPQGGSVERIYYRFNNSAPLTGITNEMDDQEITRLLYPLISSQENPLVRVSQDGPNYQIDATRLTDNSLTLYVIVRDGFGRRNVNFIQNNITLVGQRISNFSDRFSQNSICMNLFYSTQRGDAAIKNTIGNPNSGHKIFDYIVNSSSVASVLMVLGADDYRVNQDNNTYIHNIQTQLSNLQNNLGSIVETGTITSNNVTVLEPKSNIVRLYAPSDINSSSPFTLMYPDTNKESQGGMIIVYCPNCTLRINPHITISGSNYEQNQLSMVLNYPDNPSETKYIFFANKIEFIGTGSYNLSNSVINFSNQPTFNLYKGMFIAKDSLTTDYSTTTNIVYGSVYVGSGRIIQRPAEGECSNRPRRCFIYQNPNLNVRYPYIHIMYDPILALRAGEYIGSDPSRYNRSIVGL